MYPVFGGCEIIVGLTNLCTPNCRTSDAKMIANFRMQAELSAVESTEDGKNIVLGTVDGCLSVLAIADPAKPEMKEYLAALPSRDEEVCTCLHFTVIRAV
jgi:cation transport ATPase